jgi:type V secretory pathway adhesin AidA
MATIRMSPGATVLTGSTHGGYERMTVGVSLAQRLLLSGLHLLDTWHQASVAAHNDAVTAQLAASDHRVLAELRAAYTRDGSDSPI